MALINCPECGREVSDAAPNCPNCGHPINKQQNTPQIVYSSPKWSPGVAAVLSLVIPGAGQMYKGSVFSGLLWLLFVVIGYALMVIPGLILHIICIVSAASGSNK
jgi:TM2 domain-containing membrane protein YozV